MIGGLVDRSCDHSPKVTGTGLCGQRRLFGMPVDGRSHAMADGLDFDRMERVSTKFHTEIGRRRESDVIWRLPTQSGTDIYL